MTALATPMAGSLIQSIDWQTVAPPSITAAVMKGL